MNYLNIVGLMKSGEPPEVFSDNFDDNTTDTDLWDVTAYSSQGAGVTVAEVGGAVLITRAVSASGINRSGYQSKYGYNFTNKYVQIECVTTSVASGVITRFGLALNTGDGDPINLVQFLIGNGTGNLTMRDITAGTTTDTTVAYDGTNHKWLRFEHDGSNILFRTSADGSSWTTRRTLATPFTITNLRAHFLAETNTSVGSPGTATFNHFTSSMYNPTITDSDATAFLSAAGITDDTIEAAVHKFVLDLKYSDLWAKINVAYLGVGGTADTHKYNLKDPQNTDGANRLSYSGNWGHGATAGLLPNGVDSVANTFFNPVSESSSNSDFHLSLYKPRANLLGTSALAIGVAAASLTNQVGLGFYSTGTKERGAITGADNGDTQTSPTAATASGPTAGMTCITCDGSRVQAFYTNGIAVGTHNTATGSYHNDNIFLGATNGNGTASNFFNVPIYFASIGLGLTANKAQQLYLSVHRLQVNLARTNYFQDLFNDNLIDSANKWTIVNSADLTLTEQSSTHLRITADASYSGSANGASVTSIPAFDFTGRQAKLSLLNPGSMLGTFGASPSGGTQFVISDTNDPDNYALIVVDQDTIFYRRSNNGTTSESSETHSSHVIWIIEHVASNNTWRFYTALDATSTPVLQFTSAAANWNPTSVKIGLGGYIYGTNMQSQTTQFDSIVTDAPYVDTYDVDAANFISAALLTDSTQKSAINQLVLDFKAAGIWPKMQAIYPYIGGSATTHKWNLKNPLDTDGAFRGTFSGTVTHDANGITPNGTTGYMDTKLNGSTQSLNNDSHLSVYVRTNSAAADKTEINAYNGASAYWGIKARDTGDITFNGIYRFTADGFISVASNTDSSGFYTLVRRSSSDAESYKNGASTGTTTTTSQSIPSSTVKVGARGDGTASFSDRNIAFASIGTALTDAEVTAFHTAVQAYQTTLSRQV